MYEKINISTVLFLLLSFISAGAQQENVSHTIVVLSNNIVDTNVINNVFSVPMHVDEISFESDVIFSQEEFEHLFPFSKNNQIKSDDLIVALELCSKKNKFFTIKIIIFNGDDTVRLHFVFEAAWTFKKIKIHNVYQGKHAISQFYVMERGDLFDQSKHEHSIAAIKEYLVNGGYFDCNVTSELEYDNRTKELMVHIFIKKGKRFSFGEIDVVIHGESGECDDNDELRKQIKKKIAHTLSSSRTCTQDQINRELAALKDYMAKKGFFHSTIKCKQKVDHDRAVVNLLWKITINQKREIVFFGHRFFSKKELFEKIVAFGESVCLLPATILAEEIVRAYKNKGFLNVEVITQEEKDRSFFIIKEGPRAVIKAVEIKNGIFGDQSTIKKRCLGKLLKHGYYDTALYDEAVALLTNYYFNCGFVSFVVVHYELIPTTIEHEFVLVVTVDEGVQKFITQATVEDYPELNTQGPFIIHHGDNNPVPFTSKMVDEQREWLIAHFQSLGYMHPRCKAVVESQGSDVSLKWVIDTGEKVCFGKTVILGSTKFPFSYIQEMLRYKEGELWDHAKIKQTFRNFKELEIFESIHLSSDATNQEYKPVLLKLDLDDRYEIRTRAGLELQHVRKYQTFSGLTYKLGGTALIKNPTNAGDQMRFDCDFARSHREIVGSYRRPWFEHFPFFTTMQVYSIVYDQPAFIGSFNDLYTLIQHGFLLGMQKKTEHVDLGINGGCDWMKMKVTDNPRSLALAIDFQPRLIDKLVPFFFIEPTVMVEWLDDLLNPSRGGVTLFSLKGMVPMNNKYKDTSFFKLLCEQSFFVPLRVMVGAVRLRFGHIFYREFSAIMPSERFYLGGSHSLRGYDIDLAPPLGIYVDDEDHEHIVPRGGRTMVNANIELRIPVYKKRIGMVLFQDLGALSGTMFADFKHQDILAATGFGVRFFTPVGPLRFDIGWKWHKQIPQERSFAWFLTFGQAF